MIWKLFGSKRAWHFSGGNKTNQKQLNSVNTAAVPDGIWTGWLHSNSRAYTCVHAAHEAGCTFCDAPNKTMTTAISRTFPNVAGLSETRVCLLFSVAATSRRHGVLQLIPLSRIFGQNLRTSAQIMSFPSIPRHNTAEHFRRNCKLLFRMKDTIHPEDDNRTPHPMAAVLAPNTLSQPQIARMVLKRKNGHSLTVQTDWFHSQCTAVCNFRPPSLHTVRCHTQDVSTMESHTLFFLI